MRERVITNVDISFQFAISENGNEAYAKEHQALIGKDALKEFKKEFG